MTYEEMDFDDVFDGIWACASLVHLTEEEMKETLDKLVQALKMDGILYLSVHKGDRDGIYNGRYFRDYTKKELYGMIEETSGLELIDIWTTQDVRPGKKDRMWLNVLARKVER